MTEQNRGQHSKQAANPTKRLVRDAEEQASEQGDRMSILVAIGTRPEAIKMIPVIRALQQSEDFFPIVISTGQHEELVAELFREAGMRIDATLHASRREAGVVPSLNEMVARIIMGIDRLWAAKSVPEGMRADGRRGPRGAIACIVHGDTSSASAAALAAFNLQIPVIHVEAGLRTSNLMEPFPEEGNRQIISRLAAVHFAPTAANKANLVREGVAFIAIAHNDIGVLVAPLVGSFIQRLVILVERFGEIGHLWRFIQHALETFGHRFQRTGNGVRAGGE